MKVEINNKEYKVISDALKFHKSYYLRTLEGIVNSKEMDQDTKRSMYQDFAKSSQEISEVLEKLGQTK